MPPGSRAPQSPRGRRRLPQVPRVAMVLALLTVATVRPTASQATGVPTRLYKIPSSYKARLEAFSPPPSPQDVPESTTPAATTTEEAPQRRRHIQVSSPGDERFGHYCDGKECEQDPRPPAPEGHPASKELLDRFLKDYQALNGGSLPDIPDKDAAVAFLNEQLNNGKYEPESNPSNRLTNSFLGDDFNSTDKETRSKGAHWGEYSPGHHQHPDEDRDGWVTLEAVPWSQSKISKWYTSNKPHWSNAVQPARPSHDWGSVERPPPWEDRPSDWPAEKPSRPEHWQPHSDDRWQPPARPVPKPSFQYHPSSHLHHDIVTDDSSHWGPHGGVPGVYKPWPSGGDQHPYTTQRPSAPSYHHEYRPSFHHGGHPPGHPENSDGEWVLVSNTKGYSTPQRYQNYKRALTFSPKPMTSTRTVRLTVLPDANTTTSHGGLLEVQGSFSTVDEDRAAAERRKQLLLRPQNDPVPTATRYPARAPVRRRPAVPVRRRPVVVVRRPVQTRRPVIVVAPGARPQPAATTAAPNYRGRAAMLAAVTAGVVPATMAVVVPAMMMGRRRRRRRRSADWRLVAQRAGRRGHGTRKVVRRRKGQPDKGGGRRLVLPPPHIRAAFQSLSH